MSQKTVLILDCHLRSQEGVIESLFLAGYKTVGLSWNSSCAGFSSKFLHEKILSPRLEDCTKTYVDFLLSLSFRGIVLISNDLSALTMARHKQELESAGFQLLIPTLTKLEAAFDKWQCFNSATKCGVKAPQSAFVSSLEEAMTVWPNLRKPVILKPTRLAGGNYIKLSTLHDLEVAWTKVSSYNSENPEHESSVILQEWLSYGITDMWSCETVYDKNSQSVGFYSIQRIRSSLDRDTGNFTSRLFAGEYQKNPRLEAITKKLLDSLEWVGLAHVEYMYLAEDDEYYLAEINPRLPGYSYFPTTAGFELGRYYCDLAVDEVPNVPREFKPAVYFESFRYPGDLSEGIYHLLKRNLTWGVFLASYGRLFRRKTIKVIEPIRVSDLGFTWCSLKDAIKGFVKDVRVFVKGRAKR